MTASRFGVRPQAAQGQRIGEEAPVLQDLMGGAVAGRSRCGTPWLFSTHAYPTFNPVTSTAYA